MRTTQLSATPQVDTRNGFRRRSATLHGGQTGGYPHGYKRFDIASDPPFPSFSRLNYHIHTDAIEVHIIPATVTPAQTAVGYANEAGLLNVALFRRAARQRRGANPTLAGEMRDHAAIERLSVMANLEGMNAELIQIRRSQGECLKRLNETSRQLQTLTAGPAARKLGPLAEKDG